MQIEIFADFSCPWCFIGRRRLARAQLLRPQLRFELVWQPFQLNPEAPMAGADRRRHRGLFQDVDRLGAMERALEESGGKEGIRFAFDRIARIPNTLAAHRLMRFAARSRRDDALAERLYSAYFEEGKDIGNVDTLADCAAAAGLERRAAWIFLISEEEAEAVKSIDGLAHQSGIAGVPYFVLDRRYALAGAQEPAVFLPLFDAVLVSSDEMLASPA